ncbi:MAG: ABC transporter ATP-binding protein [Nitrospirae bacterium]|nr:ABC transporter ATP-binding protein [Nitrospirota bacterium]
MGESKTPGDSGVISTLSASPAIEVRDLAKSYRNIEAVRGVSFDVRRGEIVGLLGPNGAGKTTILQTLLGTLTPTSGQVRFFGLDFAGNRESILARVNFSSTYVSLPYSLTVRENLGIFARLYGAAEPGKRVQDVLDRLDLADLAERYTSHLSSGQMTRVCLAKALINDPEVLLLDEPTASLDPDMADRVRKTLVGLRRDRNTAILVTSHNMREIEALCDRVLFLQAGRIVMEGPPREIAARFGDADLETLFLRVAREGRG